MSGNKKKKTDNYEIIKIMLLLSLFAFFIFIFYMLLSNNEIENKGRIFALNVYMFAMFEVCLYFNMHKRDRLKSIFKIISAVVIMLIELLLTKVSLVFIPFLLPVALMVVYLDVTNALILAAIMCETFFCIGRFNGFGAMLFMFYMTLTVLLFKNADSIPKKHMACLISIVNYLVIFYLYQQIVLCENDYIDILKGIPALIISMLPLYLKTLLKQMNNNYLIGKLKDINDDENELLLTFMDTNPDEYFHSIRVAEVAVKVAEEMNCNKDLVKAAARFHEIGKLNGKNYIEEGIKIMKQNHFPMEVIKIIREHNSKTNYPKTMESAIVMLADSIETTLDKLSSNNLDKKKIISQIIDIRFDSGNLDYAIDSAADYKKIRTVFMSLY